MGTVLSIVDAVAVTPVPAQSLLTSVSFAYALYNFFVLRPTFPQTARPSFIEFVRTAPVLSATRRRFLRLYSFALAIDVFGSLWWKFALLKLNQQAKLARALTGLAHKSLPNRNQGPTGPTAVCMDLDHTLLRNNGTVSNRAIEALHDFKARGGTVILASGRGFKDMVDIAKDVDADFSIALNGSSILCGPECKVFEHASVDLNLIAPLIQKLQSDGAVEHIAINYHQQYDVSSTQLLDELEAKSKGLGEKMRKHCSVHHVFDTEYFRSKTVSPLSVSFVNFNDSATLRQTIQHAVDSADGELYKHFDVVDLGLTGALMLAAKGVSKASALEKVCDLIGAELSEVVAFGDNLNDLSMLREVGYSIAMKNGTKEAKEVANEVSRFTNDDDGVAVVVEELLATSDPHFALRVNMERSQRQIKFLQSQFLAVRDERNTLSASLKEHEQFVKMLKCNSPVVHSRDLLLPALSPRDAPLSAKKTPTKKGFFV